MSRIAFYAPMKPPDHPTPSGDREIARLTLRALEQAGREPFLASRLRVIDTRGDAEVQAVLREAAAQEVARLSEDLAVDPPSAWFTYHCHYKAPDLVGPAVAVRLGIPYFLSEPSISTKRREGPWAAFAAAAENAIAAAERLFWTTERDRTALEAAGHGARMVHLPAFLDPGPEPAQKSNGGSRLRLLTVAMMRPGDKVESYRRLAAGLACLDDDWRLTIVGDGAARREVESMFDGFGERVDFAGAIDDRGHVRQLMEAADVLVWPGVNEGVGMVWLEAMAAGTPVVAEDGPAARSLIAADAGRLAEPGAPGALAKAIGEAVGLNPRPHVLARHGIGAAARVLSEHLP